jgi:flagellar biosynthesis/type III secretory pathway protein FliH
MLEEVLRNGTKCLKYVSQAIETETSSARRIRLHLNPTQHQSEQQDQATDEKVTTGRLRIFNLLLHGLFHS